jgi:hypothetical protein
MRIVRGDREGQWRITRPPENMLCGLITQGGTVVTPGQGVRTEYHVEMFMQVDAKCDTEAEAMAFAKGVWAACDAFGILGKFKLRFPAASSTTSGAASRMKTTTAIVHRDDKD